MLKGEKMTEPKPIMIRPNEKGREMIEKAVAKIVEQGKKCSISKFCQDAAVEKAEQILKK